MLSRRDIRPLQTKLLLDQGLLPVSIDYRLCPEVTLSEGPMSDACSALKWVREILPTISLKNKTIHADGNKVVAIGWSTGGQLAMSLAWTAPSKGIEPPTAILAFYCATDYSADFWKQPNIPKGTHGIADCYYNIWEGFEETPITQYNVPASRQPIGGWLSVSDPRSRIALHMNWAGQSIPILLGRMKTAQKGLSGKPMFEQPTTEEIDPINPRAQIEKGNYKTPTYMVHGTADDLIPFEQTKETYEKLVEMEVEAGVKIVEGEAHLFDLREGTDKKRLGVIEDGYEFLFRQLRRSK
jgi:acetyl esterase/lipase